jgi:hypothetical protein
MLREKKHRQVMNIENGERKKENINENDENIKERIKMIREKKDNKDIRIK